MPRFSRTGRLGRERLLRWGLVSKLLTYFIVTILFHFINSNDNLIPLINPRFRPKHPHPKQRNPRNPPPLHNLPLHPNPTKNNPHNPTPRLQNKRPIHRTLQRRSNRPPKRRPPTRLLPPNISPLHRRQNPRTSQRSNLPRQHQHETSINIRTNPRNPKIRSTQPNHRIHKHERPIFPIPRYIHDPRDTKPSNSR